MEPNEMEKSNESAFLHPVLTIETLDHYWVRNSILDAIKRSLPYFTGTLLDVGCGQQPYRSILTSSPSSVSNYIGLDLQGSNYGEEDAPAPDLRWDGMVIPLDDSSIDVAFATEVLEHCPDPELVMREIYRVLRPGGRLFFTVPFLWPLHEVPFDFYRYTPFALEQILVQVGFKERKIEALGGWDASLGQMIGLWLIRRPISHRRAAQIRSLLSFLLFPLVRFLYKKDRRPDTFPESSMTTGLSCLATK